MTLTDDTAGGVWGVGGESWLHIDASGAVLDDFQLSLLPSPWTVRAVDASAPERLLVSAVWSDGELFGDILLFETEARAQSILVHQDQPVGDLAATQDAVVFVSYGPEDAGSFTVKRALLQSGATVDLATLPGSGGDASVDIDAAGKIYVATGSSVMVLASDGTVEAEFDQSASEPQIAVSPSGRMLVTSDTTGSLTPTLINGGTAGAREVISRHTGCGGGWLTVMGEPSPVTLEALCDPAGITWLSDESFLVSVGDEGGATLVAVSVP